MELSVNGRQRRAVRTVNTALQTEKRRPTASTAHGSPRTDRTAWSRQALAFLQEVSRQDMENQRKLLEAKQRKNSGLEALSKSLKVMERCQKIAARIMRGDKVPPQDEQYLMERDPDGYKLALACREPKEDPKEWESVLTEEDQEPGSAGDAESVEAEAVSGGETAEC